MCFLWIFSSKLSSCEDRNTVYSTRRARSEWEWFSVTTLRCLYEHISLYMSPVFGNGAASNGDGRDILCEQESKLMKTLLHRHWKFTSAVWIIIVLISSFLQASRDIYCITLQHFKLFLCTTYKLKIYWY